jgi:hypothetical protein
MQWIPFLPKGGGMIQVDIGGHPPIPLAQRPISILAVFFLVFQVLNFQGRFEALNNIFWGTLLIQLCQTLYEDLERKLQPRKGGLHRSPD